MPRVAENLTGRRFNRLLVIEKAITASGHTAWKCQCDCGTIKNITSGALRCGGTTSCGCYLRELRPTIRLTHGHSKKSGRHPLYARWNMMIQRCENPNNNCYPRYGGRGIRVCRAWHSFPVFFAWASANGYEKGLWIERKNNDGNYTPRNCTWANQSQQARNRRPIKLSLVKARRLKAELDKLPRGGRSGVKRSLALKYGVSPTTISNIANGDTWKRLVS